MNGDSAVNARAGSLAEGAASSSAREGFSIPVLCYHSSRFTGDSYQNNDHIALERDLKTLGSLGYEILPPTDLVAVLRGIIPREAILGRKLVCFSCDDGGWGDYHDSEHPQWGTVPSFHRLLEESQDWIPSFSPGPRAVSFVIASPEAREYLGRVCGDGRGDAGDAWWQASAERGVLGIANHSWDHLHPKLPAVRQRENRKGSFFDIDTFQDAQSQIDDAQEYIDFRTGHRSLPLFCYPFGHVSAYLRDEYFPAHGERLGLLGAFSTAGRSVGEGCDVWDIPRFVFGWHWKDPSGFEDLIAAVQRREI